MTRNSDGPEPGADALKQGNLTKKSGSYRRSAFRRWARDQAALGYRLASRKPIVGSVIAGATVRAIVQNAAAGGITWRCYCPAIDVQAACLLSRVTAWPGRSVGGASVR